MTLCPKDGSDGRNERFAFIAGRFEVIDVVAYGDAEMDPCRDEIWDVYWFILLVLAKKNFAAAVYR
jgi:hypothetical protein